jgi:hypothetical protein
MIFVRSSCLTWNHNGNTCIQYPSQWKLSLRTFYGRHHNLFYPKSVEVITKKILRLSKFVLPLWNAHTSNYYESLLFYWDFFFPLSPTIFSEEQLLTLREHMVSLLSSVWFVLDLLTNVICVSWFHPLPNFRWDSGFDHQCCLCPLGSPPVLYVTCFLLYILYLFFRMKTMFGSSLSSAAGQMVFTYFWWFVYICV